MAKMPRKAGPEFMPISQLSGVDGDKSEIAMKFGPG